MSSSFYLHGFLALVVLVFVYTAFGYIERFLISKENVWYKNIRIKNSILLTSNHLTTFLKTVLTYSKWIVLFILLYIAIPLVFAEVPETREWSLKLLDLVQVSFINIGKSWFDYIPNAITIFVIVFVTHKFLQALHFVFNKIGRKEIHIDGFYPEWAETTFSLIKYVIIAFSLVIIYPYFPGSESKAFQGMSVFVGLLLSLGSSNAIANIVAGVVITYMRPFKVGDYVLISGTKGKIIEKGITVTKICTYKNETVTIPNTKILGSEILNYSIRAEKNELVVYTSVTIGYDTPWKKVHEMLKMAAKASKLINQEKESFVLQNSLNDYHVTYELNAYTSYEEMLPMVYSELHENIQNQFTQNGVEIMSPMFNVIRNKPENTVPPRG